MYSKPKCGFIPLQLCKHRETICLFNFDVWQYYTVHVVTMVINAQRKTVFLSFPVKQPQHQIQPKEEKKKKKHSKLLAVANKCFITAGDASGSENMMHRAAVSTHLAVRYVLHPRPGVKYGFMCSCEHVITCVSLLLARRSDVCNIHGQHVTAVSGCYCLYRRTQSESTANLVNLLQISKCCQCLILIIDCTSILNMRSITMFQPFTQQPLSNLRLNNSLFTF